MLVIAQPGSDDNWYPLDVRGDAERVQAYDTPVEGVPPWLEQSLWDWVRQRVSGRDRRSGTFLRMAVLQECERRLRIALSQIVDQRAPESSLDAIRNWIASSPPDFLALIDFLLSKEQFPQDTNTLRDYLREGGSVWTVDTTVKPYALVRRVSPEFRGEFDAAVGRAPESSATLLSLAWRQAYGLEPHPSDAYRSAVRAAEALLVPVALPKDPSGTLGKAIKHLADAQGRWSIALPGDDSKVDAQATFLSLLRHLWTGQYDRHVTEGSALHVSQPEAEQAVLLAVAVVQLIVSGAFQYQPAAD